LRWVAVAAQPARSVESALVPAVGIAEPSTLASFMQGEAITIFFVLVH
jgi:hypothetical protein